MNPTVRRYGLFLLALGCAQSSAILLRSGPEPTRARYWSAMVLVAVAVIVCLMLIVAEVRARRK